MVTAYQQATITEVNYAQNPQLSKYIDAGVCGSTRLCKQRLPTDDEL
jgi:hypothetical protein